MTRPFRFGLSGSRIDSRAAWRAHATQAEASGYDVLLVADHFGALNSAVALMAAAEATDRIRVGNLVLNNDFRHPLVVAQEAVTLDLLTGGRFELGLGAGWNVPEYEESGIPFDPARTRIERLEESAGILRSLLTGDTVSYDGRHYTITGHTLSPTPPQGSGLPIHIGGNGDRLLGVAGRHADIAGFTGFTLRSDGPDFTSFDRVGLAERIDVLRTAAGERFEEIELSILVQRAAVTGDRDTAVAALAEEWANDGGEAPDAGFFIDSPFIQIGTADQIAADLESLRAELGISYIVVFEGRSPGFDAVVDLLSGT